VHDGPELQRALQALLDVNGVMSATRR